LVWWTDAWFARLASLFFPFLNNLPFLLGCRGSRRTRVDRSISPSEVGACRSATRVYPCLPSLWDLFLLRGLSQFSVPDLPPPRLLFLKSLRPPRNDDGPAFCVRPFFLVPRPVRRVLTLWVFFFVHGLPQGEIPKSWAHGSF